MQQFRIDTTDPDRLPRNTAVSVSEGLPPVVATGQQLMEGLRNIRRQVLPNGLTILTEEMPHIRSVSIGIWIKTGSRHETAELNGISHFVEHMLFKGTQTRPAEQIAREVDSIGGNMDAFTAKECIC